jgi:hypothetical protein
MLAKGVVKSFLFFESLTTRLIAELLLSGNLDQAIAQLDAPHDLWPQRHKLTALDSTCYQFATKRSPPSPDVWRISPKNSPAARSGLKRESGGNQG